MFNILFQSQVKTFPDTLMKGVPGGYSLLQVAVQSGIPLHFNCGMACSCSSCHVYVKKGNEYLVPVSEREGRFLTHALGAAGNSRLGCQSVLVGNDGYLEVTIPDQSKLDKKK